MNTHYHPTAGATLKNGRYAVLRKLGEGITAVTWLVNDKSITDNRLRYFAAKILSAEATAEPHGPARERDMLQAIADSSEQEGHDYVPDLCDSFNEGPHLCLILPLYSTSVASLCHSGPHKCLPVYMVRSIIHMTLHALQLLHNLKIVHTDVRPDNILFTNARFSFVPDLENLFRTTLHTTVLRFRLIGFGHAEWLNRTPSRTTLCPPALRPPEVILSYGFGTAVDIWAIGCLAFELLVGRRLFHPEDDGDDWTNEEDHLAKMQQLTGQHFTADVLTRAKNGVKYLNPNGHLARIPELIPVSIEQAMRNYNIPGLAEEDIQESADFIRACLELDDRKRPTAEELLEYSFAKKAWLCH
ncbi:Kinase-like protein [Mycena indigotica]|uniref:non-specific serine/threonine protein kinase n=1 Tax=Mycena indigotica TaxID=2126181 RepID=A0A8H6VPX6_9AGAR|nr:Kinase-like protein [Mycena indigotica]KAF7289364.1 Kinase-like protein [Mycena indigotica]